MSLKVHIEEWRAYAAERRKWVEYETAHGRYAGPSLSMADLAERTAQALEAQEKTGEAHCSCCLKPMSAVMRNGRHV